MDMKTLAACLAALKWALPSGAEALPRDAPLATAEAPTPQLARAAGGAVAEAVEALAFR
ncbi:MAG: hypothetical protein H6897_02565 [Rhodobacteraceae bacterium]|jgi:hypothetical protein|nr:hypothetical protein [uncultured Defluviimonas sp.]MCB2124722.1 hypothetical protein [Paracoccaceae bacterium]MCC0068793.1 hypothetical protein [Paracoccaceae bacterium]